MTRMIINLSIRPSVPAFRGCWSIGHCIICSLLFAFRLSLSLSCVFGQDVDTMAYFVVVQDPCNTSSRLAWCICNQHGQSCFRCTCSGVAPEGMWHQELLAGCASF